MKHLTKRERKLDKLIKEGSAVYNSLKLGYTKIIGGKLYRGNPEKGIPLVRVNHWDVNESEFVESK